MRIRILFLCVFFTAVFVKAQELRGMRQNADTTTDSQSKKSVLERKGKDFALLFATDQYDYWPRLSNPINDVHAIAKDLAAFYGFTTEIVENPTLDEITLKLQEYNGKKFADDGQLLVYFAGHGYYHDLTKQGYLVTRDSRNPEDDPPRKSMMRHSQIREDVDNINCSHILLMMDVCMGGTIDRSIASRGSEYENEGTPSEFIADKMQYKTRLYITSAAKQYVPDGEPGHNSPFTKRLLSALRSYGGEQGFVDVHKIMTSMGLLKPAPINGSLSNNDEPGSNFFFIRLKKRTADLSISPNVQAADIYIDDKIVSTGKFRGYLEPGKHNIRVSALGYDPWEQTVELGEEAKELTPLLEKRGALLSIQAKPDEANIVVDGKVIASNNFTGNVGQGVHSIQVTAPGYVPWQQSVDLNEQPITLNPSLEREMGTVSIRVTPGDANILLDESYVGKGVFDAKLGTGKKKLKVTREGYKDLEQEILISSQPLSVPVSLQPIKADLIVSSTPAGATVEIDGVNHGVTPLTVASLAFGKHHVSLSEIDYIGEEFDIDVASDASITKDINLRETIELRARNAYNGQFSTKRTIAWTASSLAGAAALAGAYFHLQANKAYDDYYSATLPSDINDKWDAYQQQNKLRYISWGVAGALGAWSLYHWLTKPDYNEIMQDLNRENTSLLIVPSRTGVQAMFTYKF